MEEQKNEGFLLGLGFVGLIVYFIYNEEKKRLRNEAKASTQEQIAPIMETLNPTPLPPQAPARLRVLEDVPFYQDVIDNGNIVGQDLIFVVPKDTIIDTGGQLDTPFGFINIDVNKTEQVSGDTPLSRISAISADDYHNKPRELWNPPCANYLVSNLESTERDWIINYYDCNGDEQELYVDNQPKVVSAVDTTYKPDSIVTNYQSTIQKMPN
jgi:hypothetical protein